MKFKKILIGTALLLGSLSTANAGLIVTVDDFSTNQGPVELRASETVDQIGEWKTVGTFGTDIIGGWRDIRLQTFETSASDQNTTAEVRNDKFYFSSGSQTNSQFDIRWDGASNDADVDVDGLFINGVGVDFTSISDDNSKIKFVTPIVFSDLNAWFSVTFWSFIDPTTGSTMDPIVETKKLYIPGHQGTEPRQSFFTADVFETTNFANIGAIQVSGNVIIPFKTDPTFIQDPNLNLDSNGDPVSAGSNIVSYDLTLNESYATHVPEPAMASLLGLGLAGLAFARRRKAKA